MVMIELENLCMLLDAPIPALHVDNKWIVFDIDYEKYSRFRYAYDVFSVNTP
jgi:hypothetical protein